MFEPLQLPSMPRVNRTLGPCIHVGLRSSHSEKGPVSPKDHPDRCSLASSASSIPPSKKKKHVCLNTLSLSSVRTFRLVGLKIHGWMLLVSFPSEVPLVHSPHGRSGQSWAGLKQGTESEALGASGIQPALTRNPGTLAGGLAFKVAVCFSQ